MRQKQTLLCVALGATLLILGGVLFVGVPTARYLWGTALKSNATLYIPTGASYAQLCDSLEVLDCLTSLAQFKSQAQRRGVDKRVRAGRYALREGATYRSLINQLGSNRQTPVRVIFNNIRTIDRLAGATSRNLEIDSLTMLKALRNDSLIEALGTTPTQLLGLFIPNTYECYWNTSAEEFLQRMKRESDSFWNEERTAQLETLKMSREQVITLASIIYEETKSSAEMPRVSGVYHNRLRIGMPLQADPTVKFAVGDFSIKRVLYKHLETDSPYNTYLYRGLPPGPICMPSVSAIEAALYPEKHQYLYFCADARLSGEHNFARTLSEHNRNAQAYANALNRLKIR